ncbi:hypothetical protein GBA52_027957 [Prunus armeniaca]|nr:hypothetical protein GBA52_027957 [Prunus armeniaca]
MKNEILQEIPGVHARPGEEATWGWLQEAEEDLEEMPQEDTHEVHDVRTCPDHCPVCDGSFFPALLKEMSAVVGFFNKRAQKLLELHLASGFRKILLFGSKANFKGTMLA